MKIVIVGAGEVGTFLSWTLSNDGHDVTVIESSPERATSIDEEHNVKVIQGNGSSAQILKKAGVDRSDCFLAMTRDDKTNLIASSLAKVMGARLVVTRNHDQTYQDNSLVNYRLHFGIDVMINPEALSAVELAKTIRNPARVAVENFARGQIEAQRVRVDKSAKWRGKSLRDIHLPQDIRIGFIRRGEQEDVPHAETVLQEGDIVTVFGPPHDVSRIRGKLDPHSEVSAARVVILGGGETAVALIRLLNSTRFKIRIIEKNPEKCHYLAENFPHVTIIKGDGTKLRLMEEEQVGDADYFVATTGDDENNIMASIQASKLGAKHVQVVLNKSDYEEMLNHLRPTLGIESLVSPRLVTVNEVQRYLSKEPYIELFQFPRQQVRILEVGVKDSSPAAGKVLRDISWPHGAVAVALLHKYSVKVPGADDQILGGDRVVVITREETIPHLLRLLGHS
ncbi:MAG: trk system potassium uptake protein TrkA [Puniceicoccaceae bacterium 5H]|nr:MAG: trk system potassium uptake protein TrkA [Puniceicoccaceae bacterium 5H]